MLGFFNTFIVMVFLTNKNMKLRLAISFNINFTNFRTINCYIPSAKFFNQVKQEI